MGTYVCHEPIRKMRTISTPCRYRRRRTRLLPPDVEHCRRCCDLSRDLVERAIYGCLVVIVPLRE